MTTRPGFLIQRPAHPLRLRNSPQRNTGRPAEPPRTAISDAALARGGEPALGDFSGIDALSEVLRAVRLRGAVFFVVDATAPWVAEAPTGRELTPLIMPGAQHLLEYHIVTRGSCYGGLVDGTPVQLHAGDVIVFPHGDAHVMSSAPKMRGERETSPLEALTGRPPFALRVGGDTANADSTSTAEVVCGFLGCDAHPFNPLIATLPRVLHVRASDAAEDGMLASLIALAVAESKARRAGGESMLARLSELMFVEVVRRHLRSLPAEHAGWLAGLRDEVAGRALAALHARPAYAWTLDELARSAHTSRSVLAERFKHFVGEPPMTYLAQWRMQLAAGLLAGGNANVAQVAVEVGYGSEAAFSRAFKKLVGVSPAAWRAEQNTHASAPKPRRER